MATHPLVTPFLEDQMSCLSLRPKASQGIPDVLQVIDGNTDEDDLPDELLTALQAFFVSDRPLDSLCLTLMHLIADERSGNFSAKQSKVTKRAAPVGRIPVAADSPRLHGSSPQISSPKPPGAAFIRSPSAGDLSPFSASSPQRFVPSSPSTGTKSRSNSLSASPALNPAAAEFHFGSRTSSVLSMTSMQQDLAMTQPQSSVPFDASASAPPTGSGEYSMKANDEMDPLEALYRAFSSDGSFAELDEVLALCGYDVGSALDVLLQRRMAANLSIAGGNNAPSRVSSSDVDSNLTAAFGTKLKVAHAESLAEQPQATEDTSRVCRYFLSGRCMRSDCRFVHQVDRVICKFWLKGSCLKGSRNCQFLHSIPPLEQKPERRSEEEDDDALLNEALRPERNFDENGPSGLLDGPTPVVRDFRPSSASFSAAVKRPQPKTTGPSVSGGPPPAPASVSYMAPKPSANGRMSRISKIRLRAPVLMPRLPTGSQASVLYTSTRQTFFEIGNKRNRYLSKAASHYNNGDMARAKKASNAAQELLEPLQAEGRRVAEKLMLERRNTLRQATLSIRNDERVRGPPIKGRIMGGMGVCLGIAPASLLPPDAAMLTQPERAEVALDLHLLHTDEAVDYAHEFLETLADDGFLGLAFLFVGEGSHTGNNNAQRGSQARHIRLRDAITQYLEEEGYPYLEKGGVIAVDPLS